MQKRVKKLKETVVDREETAKVRMEVAGVVLQPDKNNEA